MLKNIQNLSIKFVDLSLSRMLNIFKIKALTISQIANRSQNRKLIIFARILIIYKKLFNKKSKKTITVIKNANKTQIFSNKIFDALQRSKNVKKKTILNLQFFDFIISHIELNRDL